MGPAPIRHGPNGEALTAARSRVLERLQHCGDPATAGELAHSLGLHPNTAREHLDGLVALGLATRDKAPSAGRGRPAWRYAWAPQSQEPGSLVRDYAGLATALAAQIARSSPRPQADALAAGEEWGRTLAAGIDRTTQARARWRAVELLADLGFDPLPDARATTIRLRRCPLLAAAQRQPDVVCPVHLGMVRGVLSELGGDPRQATLVPFAEVGSCLLHLRTHAAGEPT